MLSKHRQVVSIFFDIKRILTQSPNNKLMHSLAHIGVCDPLLQWLTDHLQNRWRIFQPFLVSSGVPQGSILGPLLFITFMNSITDLPLSWGAKIILYVDDILLYKAVGSPNNVPLLQQDVNFILQWLHDHGLTPNHSKTKLL